MNAVYLRFPDEASAVEAFSNVTDPQQPLARDDIGVLPVPVGETPPPGWHVNLIVNTVPDALLPFVIEPVHPRRRFAGWD